MAMVAVFDAGRPVDRAALGHRAGRHDLSARGARRRGACGASGPAWLPDVAAALAYNFFFTEPVHTFRMDRLADVVTVVVLLIVALVTSRLAVRDPEQARLAAAHAARNATIAGFAGRLLSCSGEAGDRQNRLHRTSSAVRLQCHAGPRTSRAAHRRRGCRTAIGSPRATLPLRR